MEFKSQVATSIEQSKRLLELGLKKETADVGHCSYGGTYIVPKYPNIHNWDNDIPAWSLHRLLFLIPEEVNIDGFKFPLRSDAIIRLDDANYMYDILIGIIERVIEQGYFNKDYLEEKQ